jgi:hypothetical protein
MTMEVGSRFATWAKPPKAELAGVAGAWRRWVENLADTRMDAIGAAVLFVCLFVFMLPGWRARTLPLFPRRIHHCDMIAK